MKDYSKLYRKTESTLESIRKAFADAYEMGYIDGENYRYDDANECYAKGLEDAWECAREVLFNGDLPRTVLAELKVETWSEIIKNLPAAEAIAIIKECKEERGCTNCKHLYKYGSEKPCSECKRIHTDRWEPRGIADEP